jgi:mannitol 2-dehydrogenase
MQAHFGKVLLEVPPILWECVAMPVPPARQLNQQLVDELRNSPTNSLSIAPSATPTPSAQAESCSIVHFGVGAFHRSHLAVYLDDLRMLQAVATGSTPRPDWSIIGTGVMPHDTRVAQLLSAQDGHYVLVEKSGGGATGRVISSIKGFSAAVPSSASTIELLSDSATSIVSLTITEGGYPVSHGAFDAAHGNGHLTVDLASSNPQTTFGVIVQALERRRLAGLAPFTVLSCDNLPGNGNVVRTAVLGAASAISDVLANWLEQHGAFPNGMVDRITPATTDADRAFVAEHFGVIDAWPIVCEPFRQWALEDTFVTDRPRFENVGVLMTTDVVPYEHMKLRLLNGSHSALAYHAALAGIEYVHDAVGDDRIERFIRQLMADEAAPTLETPAGIDLDSYQNELVQRFSNPAIGDTIARLCLDGSAKFPTFILQSLEHQLRTGGAIEMLTLAIAGWCQYLRGVRDDGSALTMSGDPYLSEAVAAARSSITDNAEFLNFQRVFGPHLGTSDRLRSCFDAAMLSLASKGSLATLDAWCTAPATGGTIGGRGN